MPLGSMPSCEDFQKRFDLFFDGEIDGRTMRDLALHVTRCRTCEEELRQNERLQEVVAAAVRAEVDRVDVSSLWRSIEGGLEAPQISLGVRLHERWDTRSGLEARFLALAGSAALAMILFGAFWSRDIPAAPAALANNKAQIDSISSSAPHVAVWSEPKAQTTAIWVASYEP